jgi:hypothetical protein
MSRAMSEQIDVSVYGYQGKEAPAAATFRQGATDIAEIEQATEARLDLSREPVRSK